MGVQNRSNNNNNSKVNRIVKDRDDHNNLQKLLDKQKKLEELAARKQEQLHLKQMQQKETHSRKEDLTPLNKVAGKDMSSKDAKELMVPKDLGKENTKESLNNHNNNRKFEI